MEISGKIITALVPKRGTSKTTGKPWTLSQFVLQTLESYPKHIVFEVFGEDKIQQFNIHVGEELTISFDLDAREYNGRWYNQLRAWKVERESNTTMQDSEKESKNPLPAFTEVQDQTPEELPF